MHIVNIVTEINAETEPDLLQQIKNNFPQFNVKIFTSGFEGIIGQTDVDKIYDGCETDEEINAKLEEIYCEKRLIDFSRLYPEKIFGFIEMDCHGGFCVYGGVAVKNGETIHAIEAKENGHIDILRQINTNYLGPFFEPFTRKFLGTV